MYETFPNLPESGAIVSAVDAAMPTVGGDMGSAADIIDISTRARAARRTETGRRKPVSTPPSGTPGGGQRTPQHELAEHFEITFNHHHLSLTDEMTATAFAVTLEIVRGMLQGAEAQGVVDDEQRLELDAMIKGMEAAPRLIERSG